MKGHMRERSPRHWELAVYAGKDPVTGRERLRRRTFVGGKRDAATELSKLVADVEEDKRPVTDETVGWLLDRWLEVQSRAGLSPTTLRTYRGYIRNWLLPALGPRRVATLTAGDVRELHAMMDGRAKSTQRQVHTILRGALAFAVEKEWVDRNVAALRRAPRQDPPAVRPPTPAVVTELLKEAGEPGSDLYTFVALAATLGAREGELCALRWSDVDLVSGTVAITRSAFEAGKDEHGKKGGVKLKDTKTRRSRRTLPIDVSTSDVLRTRWEWQEARYKEVGPDDNMIDDPFVLSHWSTGAGPPSPSAYSRAFRRLAESIGRPELHAHSLRHFMVSFALANGATLAEASERAGHASTAVTARVYANVLDSEESGRKVAAILGRVLTPALPATDATEPPLRP